MTTLDSDNFQRANQSGWGTASDGTAWSRVRGNGTFSIASNEGTSSAAGAGFSIERIGSGTSATMEIQVRTNPANTTNNIGTVARFVDSNNFYYGVLSGGKALIGKDVSGTFTTLASITFSYASGTFYWLKFNLVGTSLKLKAWQDGTSEPPAWTVSGADSSLTSGGYGLGSDTSSGTTLFDSFTVTDAVNSLSTPSRATFLVRAGLIMPARSRFQIHFPLAIGSRSRFLIQVLAFMTTRAYGRDGKVAAYGRDGIVNAYGRDSKTAARG